jgi:hypothetical protein
VIAVDEVTVKVVTGHSLAQELDSNPWMAAFVRTMAHRLREAESGDRDARQAP